MAEWQAAIGRVRKAYRDYFGRELNLLRPRLFSEKVQWRKLFDLDPRFAIMSDKLAARGYIARIVGPDRCRGRQHAAGARLSRPRLAAPALARQQRAASGPIPAAGTLRGTALGRRAAGRGLDHVRVDLYDTDDHIYVGELTLYSWSGLMFFTSEEPDRALGSCWKLRWPLLRAAAACLVRTRAIPQVLPPD
jgi:hypothetical protein